MSEEIPPSNLATGSTEKTTGRGPGSLYVLRLAPARWDAIAPEPPRRAAIVVIAAWLVMAWNRFGFQGLTVPRVMVRFVLIGVYGWLGLAVALWVGRLLIDRTRRRGDHSVVTRGVVDARVDPLRLLQVTGLSHQSLLVLALAVLIGQAIPIPFLVPVLAAVTLFVWFPGMLLAATVSIDGGARVSSMIVTALGYVLWLATAGRYLFDQIEHLI